MSGVQYGCFLCSASYHCPLVLVCTPSPMAFVSASSAQKGLSTMYPSMMPVAVLADSVASPSYSLVITAVILWIIHYTHTLRLRASAFAELFYVDDAEIDEGRKTHRRRFARVRRPLSCASSREEGQGGAWCVGRQNFKFGGGKEY
ncbi:Ammonium transporter [Mycena sanguinolenta]|uniref:Ammonium transporter n=1 Tax=Mycena sanguinolenta TaxID=230812 RepID=A0A8H6XNV0_9AGAR|nr:Ammonium transporter [Mycena sanguinolenta]